MSDRAGPRLAWSAWGLVLALSIGNAALQVADWPRNLSFDYGLPGSGVVIGLGIASVGAVVASRLPRNAVGWLFLGAGLASELANTAQHYADRSVVTPGSLPGAIVAAWLASGLFMLTVPLLLIFLPLLFPSGHLPSGRWRIPARLMVVLTVALLVVALLPLPGPASSIGTDGNLNGGNFSANPSSGFLNDLSGVLALAMVAAAGSAVGSLILRFRDSRGEERQQLKWFLASGAVAVVAVAASAFTSGPSPSVVNTVASSLFGLAVLGLPLAAGLAILRYRLYDIDVVINRALAYGALAAFITGIYIAIVVGVGNLIGSGGRPNLVLSIVASAVVAVAFQPVRERVQRVANRLVYGQRATPYEVLSRFNERVAETYSGGEVLPRMARILAEGTGAQRAQVWLRRGELLVPGAAFPGDSPGIPPLHLRGQELPGIPDTDRAVPVYQQGELLGALTVTMRRGESLSPVEEKLLVDLATQAGLVLKNVRLGAELLERLEELRASRQRLVAAQDEERRRLERNLHDGAQQHLVSLRIRLGLLDRLAEGDMAAARTTLTQLKSDVDSALETLRDLARGIYPPLLADKGLAAAIEAHARKATLPVVVDADGISRYPREIESAIYFCCLEALQNVQKYAGASNARVQLRASGDELTFALEDDGRGFDPASTPRGSGLQNMVDRLDALGGRMDLESAPGHGTRIVGRLRATAAV